MKQKVDRVQGDWIEILEQDFAFISIDMNEEEIQGTPKREYKLKIRGLVRKAALEYFLDLKLTHRKLDLVQYDRLQIQPYLINSKLRKKVCYTALYHIATSPKLISRKCTETALSVHWDVLLLKINKIYLLSVNLC